MYKKSKSKNPWSQSTKNMAQNVENRKNKKQNKHWFVDQKHKHNVNYWFVIFSKAVRSLIWSVSKRVIVTAFVTVTTIQHLKFERVCSVYKTRRGYFSVTNRIQRSEPKMEIAIGTSPTFISTPSTTTFTCLDPDRSEIDVWKKRCKPNPKILDSSERKLKIKTSGEGTVNSDPNNQQKIL